MGTHHPHLARLRGGLVCASLAHLALAAQLLRGGGGEATAGPLGAALALGPLALALLACALLPAGRVGPLASWGERLLYLVLGLPFLVLAARWLGRDLGLRGGPLVEPGPLAVGLRALAILLLPAWAFLASLLCRELRLARAERLWLAVMLAYLPGVLLLPTWVPLLLAALAGATTAVAVGGARERIELLAASDLPPSAQAGTRPTRRGPLLPPARPGLRGSSPSG